MKHKKTVIGARVESKWLAALDRKEARPAALAHEWADQGEVGLFVNPDTRGVQDPLPAPPPATADLLDARDTAEWAVTLLVIAMAFIAGIAAGKPI